MGHLWKKNKNFFFWEKITFQLIVDILNLQIIDRDELCIRILDSDLMICYIIIFQY